ncbi:hypothetical protein SAY87_031225 [Trapa incisa]|uniref:Uncharacterized protein n=2 Tax=Trapa TaxID=22665 RepID=A0AAN7R3U1_TRANT|nr:hypothetical protein SAY87_031225 [Trapa incisa]KAK4787175.1 hypothetical protein SAY86_011008 [Trapa natans]
MGVLHSVKQSIRPTFFILTRRALTNIRQRGKQVTDLQKTTLENCCSKKSKTQEKKLPFLVLPILARELPLPSTDQSVVVYVALHQRHHHGQRPAATSWNPSFSACCMLIDKFLAEHEQTFS